MTRITTWTALIALTVTASAMAGDETIAPVLANDVVEAVAAQDCDRLGELNKHYWTLPADAERDNAIAALESAILDLPRCGVIRVELVRVEPVQGHNAFDYRAPVGGTTARR